MVKILNWFKNLIKSPVKLVIIIVIIAIISYFGWQKTHPTTTTQAYTTAQAEKGTLVTSVSASGNITTANNVSITIQASGAIKEVFVKNGDQLTQGQAIAILTLDQSSQQKQAAGYASYLSAKNQYDTALAKYNSLQATEFTANQKFISDAVTRGLKTDDPTYIVQNATWLQAEADYKNQATAVTAAQASLNAASLSLSQTSSTITAPVAGTLKGLTITPGSIITLTSSSTTSSSTSQVLGSINQPGQTQAQVSLSEVDSVKVSEGQKVTMTLDAFPDQTFTGKVVSINTNGITASNVTTYPTVISFDTSNDHIYPNMEVTAKVITNIKNNALLIPSGAITADNGQSTVKVMKNNQVTLVNVEVGDSNDTQTEVTSGLNEGDTVITGGGTTGSSGTNTGTSPFSGFTRGFGGGGGAVRRAN